MADELQTEVRSLPRIGEPAPDFEADSTQGPLRLSNYRGKWVMLFSHPADFTPVCTTEFMAFAQANGEFEKRNVQLIGLSVDSVPSHLAWLYYIEKELGVHIPYPVIADLKMEVSRLYGMLHPGDSTTNTVRSVFFIDDQGIIRAMVYYPLSLGRSVPELLRVFDGLQFNQREKLSTPVNWTVGDPAVYPAPANAEALHKRMEEDAGKPNLKAWWLKTTS
ncbi:MAG: peroxiredoxin [Sulfobacillus acidophilus]|uniref:Peroxiredoxin n=1 Tax=Sulfobacillus acidophilus TaxID=53633 RepID=A0A2T2WJ81_9FIRM|nr:MAG: peroxiredoxin [Sulfobacillus acidophilus]